MSSEANSVLLQRSPVDCQVLAYMFGITNTEDALATVRANCVKALQHAHLRKTFKGVAELVSIN
jgi:hypothetical protein